MQVIRTFTAENLGKTMPKELPRTVTAEEHNRKFYAFDTTDVWTADGWLITAVQDDGVTHHMRKGTDVMVAKLAPETVFSFKPTPKTLYMLGE